MNFRTTAGVYDLRGRDAWRKVGKLGFNSFAPLLEGAYARVAGISGYSKAALCPPVMVVSAEDVRAGRDGYVSGLAGEVLARHTARALGTLAKGKEGGLESACRRRMEGFASGYEGTVRRSDGGMTDWGFYFGEGVHAGGVLTAGNRGVDVMDVLGLRFVALARMLNRPYREALLADDCYAQVIDFVYALGHRDRPQKVKGGTYLALESQAEAVLREGETAGPEMAWAVMMRTELFFMFYSKIVDFAERHGADGILAYMLDLDRLESLPVAETMGPEKIWRLCEENGVSEAGLLRNMIRLEDALGLRNGLGRKRERRMKDEIAGFFSTI